MPALWAQRLLLVRLWAAQMKRELSYAEMTAHDRRELRNFKRVLLLLNAGRLADMLERPRFQRYLGFTDAELAQTRQNVAARVNVAIARAQVLR